MIRKQTLARDIQLIEAIERSEEQIIKGKTVKADTTLSEKDIDDLICAYKII